MAVHIEIDHTDGWVLVGAIDSQIWPWGSGDDKIANQRFRCFPGEALQDGFFLVGVSGDFPGIGVGKCCVQDLFEQRLGRFVGLEANRLPVD